MVTGCYGGWFLARCRGSKREKSGPRVLLASQFLHRCRGVPLRPSPTHFPSFFYRPIARLSSVSTSSFTQSYPFRPLDLGHSPINHNSCLSLRRARNTQDIVNPTTVVTSSPSHVEPQVRGWRLTSRRVGNLKSDQRKSRTNSRPGGSQPSPNHLTLLPKPAQPFDSTALSKIHVPGKQQPPIIIHPRPSCRALRASSISNNIASLRAALCARL